MSFGLTNHSRPPFPGLRPFQAEDAEWFFGRERHIQEIIRKLLSFRFVSVVGSSGSGKSSLLRAGVIPRLLEKDLALKVLVFRPGYNPVHELALAILKASPENSRVSVDEVFHLLLQHEFGLVEVMRMLFPDYGNGFLFLVDQFEEVFRYQQQETSHLEAHPAQHFVKLILAASRQKDIPLYVMLTLRSDFMGDCEQISGLPEAINDGQFLIPRLKPDELKLSIEGPIKKAGLRINPQLVERLVREAQHNPDQLPVLQHALMRTWEVWAEEKKPDRPIDFDHYDKTGGIAEALSRHAEEAYHELNNDDQAGCALLFKVLTVQGSGERGVRRPQTVQQLSLITRLEYSSINRILSGFRDTSRGFLMPPGQTPLNADAVVDLSHESLMRVWSRLKLWVEEEAESASFYIRLVENARLYDQGLAGLWRDPDLQFAINWKQLHQPNESWANLYQHGLDRALSFIEASELLKAQLLSNNSRQLRQRRVLLFLALVLLSILSIWALLEREEAQQNELLAAKERDIAAKERDKLVLQKKATDHARSQAESNLLLAVTNEKKAGIQREEAIKQKEEADKQRQIAQKNAMDAALQRDAAQNATVRAEKEKADAIRSRQIAENERTNAENQRQIAENAERSSRKLRLLSLAKNLAVQSRLAVQGSYPATYLKPAIALAAWKLNFKYGGDPDDREFYLSLLSAQRWANPEDSYIEKSAGKAILSLAYSTDGKYLLSGSEDGLLRLHLAGKPGSVLASKSWKNAIIKQIYQVPESNQFLVLFQDAQLIIARIERGALITSQPVNLGDKAFAVTSVGNSKIAVVSPHQIGLWEMDSIKGIVFTKWLQKDLKIEWTSVSSTSNQILLGTNEGRIAKFRLNGSLIWESERLKNRISSLAVYGNYWAAGSSKGEAMLVLGEKVRVLNGHEAGISQIIINGNSKRIATSSYDGKVRFWNLDRADEPPITLQEHAGWVGCLAITTDGEFLASGSRDRSLRTYPIEPDVLADLLQKYLPRPLSEQEWKRYLGPDVEYEP